MMKVKFQIILLSILGFLSGCAGLNADRYLTNKQEYMMSQGNPPSYVAGYVDGCSSGRRLGGDKRFVYRKNGTRFDKEALYARGWEEGQISCRNEALAEDQVLSQRGSSSGLARSADQERHRRLELEESEAEAQMREMWEEMKK